MGNRELVVLLSLSSWCLMVVVLPFLALPWICLQFVIEVFPDHTHLLFFTPPGNFTDISYLNEQSMLRRKRDVCTL